MSLSTQHSSLSTARPTVRIRSADDPQAWVQEIFKTAGGHEFHYLRGEGCEQYAGRFAVDDAEMIVALENPRRIQGKLEIVYDEPQTAGDARKEQS